MSDNFTPELTLGSDAPPAAAEEITLTLGDAPATPATPAMEEKKPEAEPDIIIPIRRQRLIQAVLRRAAR